MGNPAMPFQSCDLIQPRIGNNIEIRQRPEKHPPSHPLPPQFTTKNKLANDAAQGCLCNGIHGGKIGQVSDLSAPDHFMMSIRAPTTIMSTPKIFVSC